MLLVLLLACSRFTSVPGGPSPTASARGITSQSDYWPGWETAADIVTVVGLPVAIATLWFTTRDLRRRPSIVFGFDSCRRADWTVVIKQTETEVEATFGGSADLSEPVSIRIHAANLGNGVATNVVWNYDFHDGVKIVQESIHGRRYMIERGYERVIPQAPTVNPQGVVITPIKIRVPRPPARVRLEAVAYCAEVLGVKESLYLSVAEKAKSDDAREDLPDWP